jgi:hypothetical protein
MGAIAGCFGYFLVVFLMSFWTDRNLDFWLSYFKGQPVDCDWWLSFLIAIFGPATLFLNLLGEACRLAI